MENNKQNSVEWLVSKMPTAFKELTVNKELIKQAKEMHKQEIIDAIIESEKEHMTQAIDCYPPKFVVSKAQRYYQETYGQ